MYSDMYVLYDVAFHTPVTSFHVKLTVLFGTGDRTYDLAQAKTYPGLLSTTKMYCTSTVKNFLDAVSQGDPLNKNYLNNSVHCGNRNLKTPVMTRTLHLPNPYKLFCSLLSVY